MSRSLRRFLHLERPRPAAGGPPLPASARDRFTPPPPRDDGLELDLRSDDEQPFLRCRACGADSARFTERCSCGADLSTPDQRAYNEELWAERRRERAAEAALAAGRAEAAREAAAEASRASREAAEAMAREVGRRERERLDAEGWGLGARLPPWATALLRRLRR